MSHAESHDRQHPTLTLGVLSLSALAYILLQSMVLPALPEIGHALHTSQSTVAWVLTAYLISASVATPVLGRLGDMFGKKRVLLIVLASLIVGSVLAALTSSVPVMLTARVIQGGGGAIFPLAFSIVRDEFPRERVAGAIGLLSALIGIGAGVAIVIAGPIVDNLSIHWLFWIPAVMTAVALVATIFWVPESPITAPGRISALAVITLSGWLVCLLLGVSEGGDWGWWSARVIGLFVGAVVLFAAWLVTEMRAEQPLVDVRMMRIPAVWWTNISAMLFGFGMYSVMIVVPAFLQTPASAGYGFGASITQSGLAILPLWGAMLVAGILTGAFATRYGSKVPLVVGSVLSAMGMLFLTVAHGSEWNFYVAMALVGLGIGFAFSAMSNLVVEAVPPGQTGVATGMNANVRTIGGAIGSQIVASIIAAGIVAGALPKEHGYELSFIVLGVALALAGVAAGFVPARANRANPADGHEFDTLSVDPTEIAPAEAGLAIGEHLQVSRQRVDAARNRKRVLAAALHEHARHGSALGMQDVARRAGVGIGTVYRHFPSRQALIEAIAYPFFERGLRLARAVERDHPEGERFQAYVRGFARALASDGVPGHCTWDAPAAEPVRAELRALIGGFVEEGKRCGAVRPDFAAEDAFALLWTLAALVEASNEAAPAIWERHVELLLDGLSGRPPSVLATPPVERAQWDAFVRSAQVSVEHRDPADAGRVA